VANESAEKKEKTGRLKRVANGRGEGRCGLQKVGEASRGKRRGFLPEPKEGAPTTKGKKKGPSIRQRERQHLKRRKGIAEKKRQYLEM